MAGLKNAKAQAEDQRKLLYTTKLNLATEKQKVLGHKVELRKLKDAAWVAREAAEATVNTAYERGVANMETWLSKEVAVVCKDYCTKSWGVAMDRAGDPADSELRRAKSIFFPMDIWEIPDTVPLTKQPPPTQTLLTDAKVPKRARGGKEAQFPMKAKFSEDALTIRDVVS